MKERPITFSAEMVKAILSGRKTQTRRIIKPKIVTMRRGPECGFEERKREDWPVVCPFGQPGDRLYVKEAWQLWTEYDRVPTVKIPQGVDILYSADRPNFPWESRRRPALHMPRWASRIVLEITDVRIERLQDISEDDAREEGVEPRLVPPDGGSSHYTEGFIELWQSTYGPDSWEKNPWVWVITHKRVEVA